MTFEPATTEAAAIKPQNAGGLSRLIAGTALNRLYQQGVILLILVLTARYLGPEGRGALAAAIAWVQFGGTAVGMSLGKVAFVQSRQPGLSAPLLATQMALFAAIFAGLLALCAVSFAIEGITLFPAFTTAMIAYVLVAIPFYVWEDTAFYLLTSQSLLARNMAIVSLGRTISLLLLLLLVVVAQLGIEGAMLALLAGQLVSSTLTFRTARAAATGAFRVDAGLLCEQIAKSIAVHPQTIAIAAFGTSDVLLLHALSDSTATGLYQAAWALIAIPVFASGPVGNVLYQLIAERGADRAWPQQVRLMAGTVLLFGAVALGLLFGASALVTALLGGSFAPAAELLIGLLPLGLAQVVSNLMTPQWITRGFLHQLSAVTVGLAIASIILNIALIPGYGAWGPVMTSWVVAFGWLAANMGLALWIALPQRGDTT